ncbi:MULTISPECIES: LPS export ABC transporter permease LptF [Rhodomicrobium]|uniref:LPS export ABC transporter permease LptF n=1 Tax=Rhodomicrobium TaxID=1068 RepID=UPI000B4BE7CA|nr:MULTISPECIES: LPS export ABC transporter permease LptF [Rhodomicrobium]
MDIIGRYIFRQTATSLATILITLTLIVWMTTALRQISLVTNQGQSFWIFIKITLLAMPNLIAIVAPVALLISALHSLNRLSGDSELIVLSASGSNTWRVMKPYLLLGIIVSIFTMASNAYLAPQSMRILRDYAIKVRTDLISQVLQPGKFSSPETGLTIHIAERAANGDLLGLVIHDERDPSQIMTYLAEEGHITKQEDGRALLIMRNGHIQRQNGATKAVQIVVFDSYLFDISQFGPKEGPRDFKPRERFMEELWDPDVNDPFYKAQAGKFRSELHDRLSNPLYPILFVLIVGVYLGFPRTTRDSRMQSLFAGFAVATVLRIIGLAGVNMAAKDGNTGLMVLWGVPIAGIIITLIMIHFEIRPPSLPSFSLRLWPRAKLASRPT